MADPFTWVAIAGAAVGAVGSIQQGQAANKQGKLQSAFLHQQAESERQAAAARESDFRKSQSRVMAARRAALGASGVVQSTGSPLLASEDFAGEVELQALRIREGGEVSSTRLQQQASLARLQGSQAQIGGFLRGGSLLVSGAGKAF
jgi:hypothetical protein